jgi:hypothetical protein
MKSVEIRISSKALEDMKNPFGLDHHRCGRRAWCHAHNVIGTREREVRDFCGNGREAFQGFRAQYDLAQVRADRLKLKRLALV